MYIVIEMEDINILGTHLYHSRENADIGFNQICMESHEPLQEYDESELGREAAGTVRLAGDDVYSVHMIMDSPLDNPE